MVESAKHQGKFLWQKGNFSRADSSLQQPPPHSPVIMCPSLVHLAGRTHLGFNRCYMRDMTHSVCWRSQTSCCPTSTQQRCQYGSCRRQHQAGCTDTAFPRKFPKFAACFWCWTEMQPRPWGHRSYDKLLAGVSYRTGSYEENVFLDDILNPHNTKVQRGVGKKRAFPQLIH